jgi:tryptophan synthase alpha chain
MHTVAEKSGSVLMSRIQKAFERLNGEGRKALIPFITAGDPSADLTVP